MLRVLLVNGLRTIGGEERTVVDLAAGLSARGHVVTLACTADGAFVGEARYRGVAIAPVELRGKRSVGAMPQLRRIAGRTRPDVVHFHGSYPGILGACAMLGAPAAKVWTVQLHPAWNNPRIVGAPVRRRAYARAFRFAARSVDATVCVSGALAAGFQEFIGDRSLDVKVVRNGVAAELYRHSPPKRALFRARHGIPANAPLVGLVGRLTARKGIEHFVDAIAELAREGVYAVVAGAGDATALRCRAEALGAAGRVQFIGALERIDDLVSAIDVGVLPSLAEGLPLCVMEMLAGSVPVVLSDIPMHREFLAAKAACVLVPPADAPALAAGMRDMLARCSDEGVREQARLTAETLFSVDAMVDGYISVYRSVIASGAGKAEPARPNGDSEARPPAAAAGVDAGAHHPAVRRAATSSATARETRSP